MNNLQNNRKGSAITVKYLSLFLISSFANGKSPRCIRDKESPLLISSFPPLLVHPQYPNEITLSDLILVRHCSSSTKGKHRYVTEVYPMNHQSYLCLGFLVKALLNELCSYGGVWITSKYREHTYWLWHEITRTLTRSDTHSVFEPNRLYILRIDMLEWLTLVSVDPKYTRTGPRNSQQLSFYSTKYLAPHPQQQEYIMYQTVKTRHPSLILGRDGQVGAGASGEETWCLNRKTLKIISTLSEGGRAIIGPFHQDRKYLVWA